MPKKRDNSNGTVMKRVKEPKSGGAPIALLLAILFVAVLIASGMMLWFNIANVRDIAIDFLQRIEPESQVQETYIENQYLLLGQREEKIDEREREVSQREKDQDTLQLSLEKREAAFKALQEDPESPIHKNAVYLADLYGSLPPEKAASLLLEVEDIEQIKRILNVMPNENVAAILELLPEDFAAELTLSILGDPSF